MKHIKAFALTLLAAGVQSAWAVDNYACRCDTGSVTLGGGGTRAALNCTPGSDGNDGLSASTPRLTFTGAQLNAAAPGDRFLFCRGGKWNEYSLSEPWRLAASTHANNPVTVGAYTPPSGVTQEPILTQTSATTMFSIGNYNTCGNARGGYVIRDLHMHGATTSGTPPSGNHAIQAVGEIRTFKLIGNLITGWRDSIQIPAKSMYDDCNATTPGVYRQFQGNVRDLLIQANVFEYNYSHGILGSGSFSLIEGNRFTRNNRRGSDGVHAIYWAGGLANFANENTTFRNNLFEYNSATAPEFTDNDTGLPGTGLICRVGNLTMRQMSGARIEGNTVINGSARDSCYGLNANLGYPFAEVHRDVKFLGNLVVNPGGCGICVQSVPASVVWNNVIVMTQEGQTSVSGAISTLSGSGYDGQVSVDWRNNTLYLWGGVAMSAQALGTPANQIVANNRIQFWGASGARTCFSHDAKSTYTVFDGNQCGGATQFSSTYTTLGAENDDCPSGTASFDCNGIRADSVFVVTPGPSNGYDARVQPGDPGVGTGTNAACARTTRDGKLRTGTCTIGAYQPGL